MNRNRLSFTKKLPRNKPSLDQAFIINKSLCHDLEAGCPSQLHMSECMYVCIVQACIYTWVSLYICVYVYVLCMQVYVCVYVCEHGCMHPCVCVSLLYLDTCGSSFDFVRPSIGPRLKGFLFIFSADSSFFLCCINKIKCEVQKQKALRTCPPLNSHH